MPDAELVLYKRRYVVLFLLSTVSCFQSCVWLSYSPISDEVRALYGWRKSTINLLAAWGPIIYV